MQQLQRVGAWELLAGTGTEADEVREFAEVAVGEWQQERARMRVHQALFRWHTRNPQRAARQLERLREAWCALPADPTG